MKIKSFRKFYWLNKRDNLIPFQLFNVPKATGQFHRSAFKHKVPHAVWMLEKNYVKLFQLNYGDWLVVCGQWKNKKIENYIVEQLFFVYHRAKFNLFNRNFFFFHVAYLIIFMCHKLISLKTIFINRFCPRLTQRSRRNHRRIIISMHEALW